MATPDDQWWDAQAGEYVIGTLRGPERDVFKKILTVDPEAQKRVLYWENVFSALDKNIKGVEPPLSVLPRVLSEIQSSTASLNTDQTQLIEDTNYVLNSSESSRRTETATPEPTRIDHASRRRSSRLSNRVWKSVAGLATAASIGLAALLVNNVNVPTLPDIQTIDSVTAIQNEEQQTLWFINVASSTNSVQAIAIAPPEITSEQSHQLWIVKPDNAGVSSVGLLPRIAGTSKTLALSPDANEPSVFAVSLEPKGGSPEAVPTGPVLFSGSAVFVKSSN